MNNVAPEPLGRKAEAAGVRTHTPVGPDELAIEAFRQFLRARQRRDATAGKAAQQQLRAFGISVCSIAPAGGRGRP